MPILWTDFGNSKVNEYEEEDYLEQPISLDHFRVIIFSLSGNANGFDVELYYKKYIALMTGTEKDFERASRTLEANQYLANLGRMN